MWLLAHLLYAEKHLRELLTEQRKQLEEIKKATNYDSTRKLIERYDDPTSNLGPAVGGGLKTTPQKPGKVTPNPSPKVVGPGGTPRAPGHLIGAGGTPGRESIHSLCKVKVHEVDRSSSIRNASACSSRYLS